MSYAQRKEISGNRTVAIVIVALVHALLGYAIVTGLAYNVIKKAAEDLKTFDVEEPPPPPEEAAAPARHAGCAAAADASAADRPAADPAADRSRSSKRRTSRRSAPIDPRCAAARRRPRRRRCGRFRRERERQPAGPVHRQRLSVAGDQQRRAGSGDAYRCRSAPTAASPAAGRRRRAVRGPLDSATCRILTQPRPVHPGPGQPGQPDDAARTRSASPGDFE